MSDWRYDDWAGRVATVLMLIGGDGVALVLLGLGFCAVGLALALFGVIPMPPTHVITITD